jgi:hypothetical protein
MKQWLMFLQVELSINYIIQIIKYLPDKVQQINPDLLDFQSLQNPWIIVLVFEHSKYKTEIVFQPF